MILSISSFVVFITLNPSDLKIHRKDRVKVAILDSGINPSTFKNKNINIIKRHNCKVTSIHGSVVLQALLTEAKLKRRQSLTIYDYQVSTFDHNASVDKVISSINDAIANDVDIVNLSLGFNKEQPKLKKTIEKAINRGIIIIAAGGNTYGFYTEYPALYDDVIAIGAQENNKISDYSAVDEIDYFIKGKYKSYTGTSISTAYATGSVINNMLNNQKLFDSKNFKKRDDLID
nr:S8 family serine peptidase [Rummeliibacillus suwonensis]